MKPLSDAMRELLATVYHRAQRPWAHQIADGAVSVRLRVGKGLARKVEIVFCDALGFARDVRRLFKTSPAVKAAQTTFHDIWTGAIANKYKRYRYAFKITAKDGSSVLFGEAGVLWGLKAVHANGGGYTFGYWNHGELINAPAWYRQTNWYQIFPDRMGRDRDDPNEIVWSKRPKSHEVYGGTLKGITERIAYIRDLGFTGIYMTPIFEAPSSHRYDTTDYLRIDPKLGNEDDFRALIAECKARGVRIVLDAVFNHIGATSAQWRDVVMNGMHSKYADWFRVNDWTAIAAPESYGGWEKFARQYPYETFSYAAAMPMLNWDNPAVTDYLMRVVGKWTSMGIDGWRLDVAFCPPSSLWRAFSAKVKSVNPEAVVIGESWWDSLEYLTADQWTGVMNYPLRQVVLDFAHSPQGEDDMLRFTHRFNEIAVSYTSEQLWGMYNLLSSHDVPRAITEIGDLDVYKRAMRLIYLMPGAPSVYYGEEIALPGRKDPDNRRTFPAGSPKHELQGYFRDLNRERSAWVDGVDVHESWWASYAKGAITIAGAKRKVTVTDDRVVAERK